MQGDELAPGRATAEGTARFAARFPQIEGRFRRPDDLWLSSLGLGTRGGEVSAGDDLLYRAAVPAVLERGVNLFDTALSYRMQRSERALGAALRRAIAEGLAARDELVVISKGGWLTPDPDFARTASEARRYLVRTYVDSGLLDPHELVDGAHSLEPAFLDDQIERSRRNLGLATIDLYCLEEPELHLIAKGPDPFRKQLSQAFQTLERAAQDGRIGGWGLSTWSGLLLPYTERGHLSLSELFELALDVAGSDHHLRAILLPYSLGMGEAIGLPSQFGPDGSGHAILDLVHGTGTCVFASAPLVRGRATRGLPSFVRQAFPELQSDAQRSLQFVRSTPGITSALVGMRSPDHIDENLALLEHRPAPAAVISGLLKRRG